MKKNTNQQIQFKLTEMGNISSVQDLIEGSAELCNRAEARLFYRGHSKSDFLLVPSIGRGISFGNKIDVRFTAEQERLILHRFRRHAYALDITVSQRDYWIGPYHRWSRSSSRAAIMQGWQDVSGASPGSKRVDIRGVPISTSSRKSWIRKVVHWNPY